MRRSIHGADSLSMRSVRPPHRVRSSLGDIELFAGLNARDLDWAESLCTKVTIKPGRVLTVEGTPGREAFVIQSGLVSLTGHGSEWGTLGEGALLGELALLQGSLRTATAKTITDTTLLVFNAREFASLLREPRICTRVRVTADARRHENLIRDAS